MTAPKFPYSTFWYESKEEDLIILSPNIVHFKEKFKPISKSSGGRRGKIKGFSRNSQRRLLKLLYSLEYPPELMLTLTYPKDYSIQDAKKHLHCFAVELTRHWPKSWWIWKLEFQRRGAPHFHLIGGGIPKSEIKRFRRWCSYVWYRIVNSKDEKHLQAGTRVDVLDGKKKIISYVCKYVSKTFTVEEGKWVGRFWGVINKKALPNRIELILPIDHEKFSLVKRLVRHWLKSKGNGFYKKARYLRSWYFYGDWKIVIKIIRFVAGKGLLYYIRGKPYDLIL